MNIKPLFDRVVIEEILPETKTKSGIVLPSGSQEKSNLAKVVAVGNGGVIDGKEITMQVKVGDVILYSPYAGNELKLDGKLYKILKQNDIMAVVEEDNKE